MCHHLFQTMQDDQSIGVTFGYDPPLRGFFMNFARDGDVLYSNLDEVDAFEKSLTYSRAKLAEFGVRVPEEPFREVEIDQCLHDGQRIALYKDDDAFRPA